MTSGEDPNSPTPPTPPSRAFGVSAASVLRRSAAWNVGGQLAGRLMGLVFLTILARRLSLRDMGLANLATTIVGFAAVFSELGIGEALIQRQTDVAENAVAAFYLDLTLTLATSLVLLSISGYIAGIYGNPMVRGLIAVATAAFFIRSASSIQESYLRKRMCFRRLNIILMCGAAITGLTSIALAINGAGPWSIICGVLTGNAVMAAALYAASGIPWSLSVDWHRWRDLAGYGWPVFLGGIVWMGVWSFDNLAVGKYLGASSLGAYSLAFTYGRLPLNLLGYSVSQVAFSALARLQRDRDSFNRTLLRALRLVAFFTFPIAAILALSGENIVAALLGARWASAGAPFAILAAGFTATAFSPLLVSVFMALDRPTIPLYLGMGTLPVFVASVALGLHAGVIGVALAVAFTWTLAGLAHLPFAARLTELGLRQLLRQMYPSGISAAIAAAIAWSVSLPLASVSSFLKVGIVVTCVGVSYGITMWILFRDAWREALHEARAFVPKR